MKKDTFELKRVTNHISGYGPLVEPFSGDDDSSVLDALCVWSERPDNKGKRIYKNKLVRKEENIRDDVYKYFSFGVEISKEEYDSRMFWHGMGRPYKVYYCDLVYYVDVYYQ